MHQATFLIPQRCTKCQRRIWFRGWYRAKQTAQGAIFWFFCKRHWREYL